MVSARQELEIIARAIGAAVVEASKRTFLVGAAAAGESSKKDILPFAPSRCWRCTPGTSHRREQGYQWGKEQPRAVRRSLPLSWSASRSPRRGVSGRRYLIIVRPRCRPALDESGERDVRWLKRKARRWHAVLPLRSEASTHTPTRCAKMASTTRTCPSSRTTKSRTELLI